MITNLNLAKKFMRGASFLQLARRYRLNRFDVLDRYRETFKTPQFRAWVKRLREGMGR